MTKLCINVTWATTGEDKVNVAVVTILWSIILFTQNKLNKEVQEKFAHKVSYLLLLHAAFRVETLREQARADRFCSFLEFGAGRATSTAFRNAAASPL